MLHLQINLIFYLFLCIAKIGLVEISDELREKNCFLFKINDSKNTLLKQKNNAI